MWAKRFALATRFLYVVCNKQIDNKRTAALLCVPHLIITHKMIILFWKPVVKRSSRSSQWGRQEARLKTMVKQVWWEPWPWEPAEAGIRLWGMASPGDGITYNHYCLHLHTKGTKYQGEWSSYSRSHCLVVVLTIFHLCLLKCNGNGLCTIHYTTLSLS